MIYIKKFLVIFVVISAVLVSNTVDTAKILTVFPQASRSHYIALEALLKELARRGHEVSTECVKVYCLNIDILIILK